MAVERQHHGNSQTEAALFNVNIDFFFLKDSSFKSLSLSCVLSHTLALSPSHILIFFENVNILKGPCLRY